jgi:small subunit ribosomal protein S16
MLAIRLARVGAKKQAAYRVVVMEKSRARDSRSVEIVGHYNPRRNPTEIFFQEDRVQYWLSNGAQPSDRVSRLLKTYKERPAEAAAEKPAAAGKPVAAAAAATPEPAETKPAVEASATAAQAAVEPPSAGEPESTA